MVRAGEGAELCKGEVGGDARVSVEGFCSFLSCFSWISYYFPHGLSEDILEVGKLDFAISVFEIFASFFFIKVWKH